MVQRADSAAKRCFRLSVQSTESMSKSIETTSAPKRCAASEKSPLPQPKSRNRFPCERLDSKHRLQGSDRLIDAILAERRKKRLPVLAKRKSIFFAHDQLNYPIGLAYNFKVR